MKISIVTLFPGMFEPFINLSILGRAQKRKAIEINLVNLRQFGIGRHQVVDGRPYGGGVGMVIRGDILAKALNSVGKKTSKTHVVLMSAKGKVFNQQKAKELAKYSEVIIICGHYEGVDQRFIDKYVDEELSMGDFVLTGGEIPALGVIDSVARLVKDVLLKEEALALESFDGELLEYPQYTRPESFEKKKVPEVLLTGNHQEIEKWREEKRVELTKKLRPDLLKRV